MEPLSAAEIRERYLAFFESKGHARMPSDSLIPVDDPTLLFTGAGMNQFKDMFLGMGTLPHQRVTTTQKCLRVPDLEEVGRTPRHHTFFEMLGNFSFGDYFKKECIAWEWEFFTKVLGIPENQLVVTVYLDDDEAYEIWRDDVGLDEARIYRFGEKENFWPAEAPSKGPNGPCGPCSEIYYDATPDEPQLSNDGLHELPGDRYTEIGNCVFTQFDRQSDGSLPELPQRNIDVGLGLERITAVLAGVPTNFDTDLFVPYIRFLEARSGKKYGAGDLRVDQSMRRVSDHVRAVTFCIADGAVPGNEGRGYVVRKIVRRAIRDGYELGIDQPFLNEMVDVVGEVMGDVFPEIRQNAGQCRALIKTEEESFAGVYRQGVQRLDEFLEANALKRGDVLPGSGAFAFQLHDTFGFPGDITSQIMADRGFVMDQAEFDLAMRGQRDRARAAMKTSEAVFADNAATALASAGIAPSEFCGYDRLATETEVLALVGGGNRLQPEATAGDEVILVVAETPFYAEGGGQVGDSGRVEFPGGSAEITNTERKGVFHLHHGKIVNGRLAAGAKVQMLVDAVARRATERHHTATHLMHAALKRVLGDHVNQSGSVVSPDRLRFDFTHGEKLSDEQIHRIEDLVNDEVTRAIDVEARVQSMDAARAAGFVALFGEKYGDEVRTLAVGEFSKELCGGTHVPNSGAIGAFRIVSETAISAGNRRIEAVAGPRALAVARAEHAALDGLSKLLKTPQAEVPERVRGLLSETKKLRKELEKATAADLGAVLADLEKAAVAGDAGRSVVFEAEGLSMKDLQELLARVQQSLAPVAAIVFAPGSEGVLVGATVSKSLTGQLRAGDLVKTLAGMLGGGGGGRPESAQGKGKDRSKLPAATEQARQLLAAVGLA